MSKFILRRLLMMIPVIIGVSFVIFLLLFITPGDPARTILGETAKQEDVEKLRVELGLDKPFLVQYGNYIFKAVTKGDLGISYTTKLPVVTEIFDRLPTTMLLALLSVCISICIGIPLGIIAATKQYSILDHISTVVALLGVSMPNFWTGLMLIIFFAVFLGILPASGFYGPQYWVLPSITIGFSSSAIIMRMTRSSMLEVIRQDYIRTAKAKGQSNLKTITHHALKNALIPIVTVVGLQFGNLLGGAVLTESIFSIPGLGKLMVDSIRSRNYPVVQGGVLLMAIIFCFINLAVDVLYAFVDPRIKSMYKSKKNSTKKTIKEEAAA